MADDLAPWEKPAQQDTPPWGPPSGNRVQITVRPRPGSQGTVPTAEAGAPWAPPAPVAPQAPDTAPPPDQSGGLLSKALEPITSYWPTQQRIAGESIGQMKQGVEELGTSGERWKGAMHTGLGALRYLGSPIESGLHTVAGKPLEENFGIPHDYTEFALGLAIPYYGLTGASKSAPVQTLNKVFNPEKVSREAEQAGGLIREKYGQAARASETTKAELEGFHATVNALPDADRLNFIDYVEGRSQGAKLGNPGLQAMADIMRDAFEARRTKLQNMPSTAQANFIQDYFPHFWQDPGAAQQFMEKWGGASKQGSGASLRARTMPTVADGIAAGLKPLTTNPIEATSRYIASMDHFIAANEVMQAGKDAGSIRFIKPKTMGASGHPDSFRVPDGWAPLEGRGAVAADGSRAYAPEDWARVYNNFISRGFHNNAEAGKIYDAVQSTSNAITSLELGLSGYHAFTMANEAIISEVARGISQLVGGKPITAIGTVAKAVAAPVRTARLGHKGEQIYLGRTQGTPDFRRLVDLQTAAGGRAVGKSHASDYRYSQMGSYWTAWKRGALKQEMSQSLQNIKARPIVGTFKEAATQIGRIMETVAQPLFEKYIPKVKNGAFYDTMRDWIEANPKASYDEQVAAARKIWDSIDNRFGEMVQDNIFWNKTLKQTSQIAMRSYSWNMGTIREIGGGVKDIAQGKWTPRASYVVALPIVVATNNAVYQYLKTGKPPESMSDLVAGRTGGTAPGFGGRGEVDERASMPGYQKDVFGWWEDARQEFKNKVATGPRMAWETMWNEDWRGDRIWNPNDPTAEKLGEFFYWVTQSLGPISVRQMIQGQKEGSNISTPEGLAGIRPAASQFQDPEGHERGMSAIERRKWQAKTKHDQRKERQYGGPSE